MALKHVNVVIVGAGAGGGIAAKELASGGLSVVLLERGKWYTAADCRKDDLRNQRTSPLGNNSGPDEERNPRVVVDLNGQERVVLPSEGGYSNNAACVGGGTFTYGAQAWRYQEKDFRMASTYGVPEGSTLSDWPISYADLEPYYEKAEYEIGVSGDVSADPFHGPRRKPLPMPPLPVNREYGILKPAAQRLGLHPFDLPMLRNSVPYNGRPPCMQCRWCVGFACEVNAKCGTQNTAIPAALATGNCELRTGCMAREVMTDARGRVTGVAYYDADDRLREQTADIVIVSSAAVESARLLLNSKSKLHPGGPGQSLRLGGAQSAGTLLLGRVGPLRFRYLRRYRARREHRRLRLQPRQPGPDRRRHAGQRIHPPAVSVCERHAARYAAVGARAQGLHAPVLPPQHRDPGADAGDSDRRIARGGGPEGEGLLGPPGGAPLGRQASEDDGDRGCHGGEGRSVAEGGGRHPHVEEAAGEGNQRRPAPGGHLPHGRRSARLRWWTNTAASTITTICT